MRSAVTVQTNIPNKTLILNKHRYNPTQTNRKTTTATKIYIKHNKANSIRVKKINKLKKKYTYSIYK